MIGGKSYIIGVGFLSEFLWWEAHSYGRIRPWDGKMNNEKETSKWVDWSYVKK